MNPGRPALSLVTILTELQRHRVYFTNVLWVLRLYISYQQHQSEYVKIKYLINFSRYDGKQVSE
jgi:hypothetical protein